MSIEGPKEHGRSDRHRDDFMMFQLAQGEAGGVKETRYNKEAVMEHIKALEDSKPWRKSWKVRRNPCADSDFP